MNDARIVQETATGPDSELFMINETGRNIKVIAATLALLCAVISVRPGQAQTAEQQISQLQQKLNDQLTAKDAKGAEKTAQAMIQFVRTRLGANPQQLAVCFVNLAQAYQQQSRYKEAEEALQTAIPALSKSPDYFEEYLNAMHTIADVYVALGRLDESEQIRKAEIQANIKQYGAEHLRVGQSYLNYAMMLVLQNRLDDAERYANGAKVIFLKHRGPRDPLLGSTYFFLSTIASSRGQPTEAADFAQQALTIDESQYGRESVPYANTLHQLSMIEYSRGQLRKSEGLARQSSAILSRKEGRYGPSMGGNYYALALVQREQGRYAEAEESIRAALTCIGNTQLDPDQNYDASTYLSTLASILDEQTRSAEAIPLYRRALDIRARIGGPNHPSVGNTLDNLANAYVRSGQMDEAVKTRRQCVEVLRKAYPGDHFSLASALLNLGFDLCQIDKVDEGLPLVEQGFAMSQRSLGADHYQIGFCYYKMAQLKLNARQMAEAESLATKALDLQTAASSRGGDRFRTLLLRANIRWQEKRTTEALADLARALEIAEEQRSQTGGAERERAQFFGSFTYAFDLMVKWQIELGNIDKAIATMERGRAKAFMDELRLQDVDLFQGRTPQEVAAVRKQEESLRARASILEGQWDRYINRPDGKQTERDDLAAALATARDRLYAFYRDVRATSPVYRELISDNSHFLDVTEAQRETIKPDALLLMYSIGDEISYVAIITHAHSQVFPLDISKSMAKVLNISEGPLTAAMLQRLLADDQGTGVLQQLSVRDTAEAAIPRLAALWQILIPEPVRDRLTGGTLKQLIVLPDGPLAMLPLETLVVESGTKPTYLLTVGPPISYVPSITVLDNLRRRDTTARAAADEPVLSLGNPAYGELRDMATAKKAAAGTTLAARTSEAGQRYSALRGGLAPLPFSGLEANWVSTIFDKAGMRSLKLVQRDATEANLRRKIAGRQIVHLACHGLTDADFGNFFGALAVTPGEKEGDPSNDGFLTLPEIYSLDLRRCDLAILSACMTNYGPRQVGEGVWALSRGFLVAGAKRVVASNWVVDDQAGASLISYFAGGLAKDLAEERPADYAASLQAAKRWVQSQEKWQSPFYWAGFVLVGPP